MKTALSFAALTIVALAGCASMGEKGEFLPSQPELSPEIRTELSTRKMFYVDPAVVYYDTADVPKRVQEGRWGEYLIFTQELPRTPSPDALALQFGSMMRTDIMQILRRHGRLSETPCHDCPTIQVHFGLSRLRWDQYLVMFGAMGMYRGRVVTAMRERVAIWRPKSWENVTIEDAAARLAALAEKEFFVGWEDAIAGLGVRGATR